MKCWSPNSVSSARNGHKERENWLLSNLHPSLGTAKRPRPTFFSTLRPSRQRKPPLAFKRLSRRGGGLSFPPVGPNQSLPCQPLSRPLRLSLSQSLTGEKDETSCKRPEGEKDEGLSQPSACVRVCTLSLSFSLCGVSFWASEKEGREIQTLFLGRGFPRTTFFSPGRVSVRGKGHGLISLRFNSLKRAICSRLEFHPLRAFATPLAPVGWSVPSVRSPWRRAEEEAGAVPGAEDPRGASLWPGTTSRTRGSSRKNR